MSDEIDVGRLLDLAVRTVHEASDLLRKEFEDVHSYGATLDIREKTSHTDFVTAVDNRIQIFTIERIRKEFPDHRFLAEEEGAASLGDSACPYEWIIDPLDGTLCFSRGRKNFGTTLAIRRKEELLAGAMCLPLLNQTFRGAKGMGAFVNDRRVKLRQTRNLSDAILSTNMHRGGILQGGIECIPTVHCGALEHTSCAIQEIGEILQGHSDGAYYDGIKLWDIAAGFLMIAEAGGKTRYEYKELGNPRSELYAVASTPTIFDELCEFTFKILPTF